MLLELNFSQFLLEKDSESRWRKNSKLEHLHRKRLFASLKLSPSNSHLISKCVLFTSNIYHFLCFEHNYHKSRRGARNGHFESPGVFIHLLLLEKLDPLTTPPVIFLLTLGYFYFWRGLSFLDQENSHDHLHPMSYCSHRVQITLLPDPKTEPDANTVRDVMNHLTMNTLEFLVIFTPYE